MGAHVFLTVAKKGVVPARACAHHLTFGVPFFDNDHASAVCVLGLIDAALGRKDEALREGRRAAELLPITKDALNGSGIVLYFAMISAWVGEKDLACEQLAKARNHSREVSYVQSNPLYCSLSAMSLVALLATETLPP